MTSATNTKAKMCTPNKHEPVQRKSAVALPGIRNYNTSNDIFSRSYGNISQYYVQFSHSQLHNKT